MLAINNEVQNAVWENNFTATPSATSIGTLLTAHATPHSKGAYAALIAATTYDSYGFWLRAAATFASSAISDMLIDIAIGASQENVIVPTFPIGWSAAANLGANRWWFPIFIPKGSAISARIQALIADATARVDIVLNGGTSCMPGPLFAGCDAYGIDEANSRGTIHTPGNTGSESEDANIGAVLAKHYGAVIIGVSGSSTSTSASGYHWELTIGGITICEWYSCNYISETVHGPFPPAPFFASLPAGTQLQVQAEASSTAQDHYISFHCFY